MKRIKRKTGAGKIGGTPVEAKAKLMKRKPPKVRVLKLVPPVLVERDTAAYEAPVEEPTPSEGRRVLVVGDLNAFAQALRDEGYDVNHLRLASEAEHWLQSRHIDVMVLDYDLCDSRGDLFLSIVSMRRPYLRERTIITAGPNADRINVARIKTNCVVLPRPLDLPKALKAVAAIK